MRGFSLGKNLFTFGGRDHIAVYFSGDNLKICCLKISPGRKQPFAFKNIECKTFTNDEIARALKAFLNETNVKPFEVILLLPSHLAITKSIEVPSTDPNEIQEIVNLQAGRHTPYAREEIIIDYLIVGSYRRNYTKVLLVIVTQNVIKRMIDISLRAGLRTDKILFSAEMTAAGYSTFARLYSDDHVIGLLNVDSASTDFVNLTKGKSLFVRSIPIGAKHFTSEGERYQIRFIDEVKKTLEVYRSEEIERLPAELILTGAIDENTDICRIITDSLHITTSTFNYLKFLQVSPQIMRDVTLKHASFFDLVSSVIASKKAKVNLVPEEIKLRKHFEEKSKNLVKTGIYAVTLIMFFCASLIGRIYVKDMYLKKLTHRYEKIIKEAEHLVDVSSKVESVKRYLSGRGKALALLSEIFSLIPGDIYFTNIRFDQTGRLTLEGKSRAMAVVFMLAGEMEESASFRNVELRRTTKRKESGEALVDFEIICMVTKELTRR